MSFEYLVDPEQGAQWRGLLPGAPRAARSVPCVQSERLRDAIQDAGVPVELTTYDGADHMWRGSPEVAADALARTIAFLLRSAR
jgi:acetyl esterase/lipase